MNQPLGTVRGQISTIEVNRVLRNTYTLLSMTLLFSAFTAWLSIRLSLPHPGMMITLVGYFGLLFLTSYLRNSAWGILSVFALTGFMGLTIGPIVNLVTHTFANGTEIVTLAMAGTGVTFLALSGFALTTRKDFSGMGKFLFVGILVAFLAGLGAVFFSIPALSLAVSAMFVLLMAGLILFETQQIVNGGETNYIMATVSLFVAIYNMFMSLLQLLSFFMGEE